MANIQSRQQALRVKFAALTLFAFCFALLAEHQLSAQMDQGTITGIVEDTAGGVIPGAQVTLTNVDTGLVLHAKTDGSGIYVFSPVKIGAYTLSTTSPGFETTRQDNIHLDLQQRLNVPLKLSPGSVTQTVTVDTAPPLLQTQEASTGLVLSTNTINDTPLNGRNWVYIAQMAAGVAPASGSRGNGNGDFNANGQRAEQNNFILDGIDNNTQLAAFLNKASYTVQPPPDALAEFKVQTSDYSAELGHSAGTVINASIKTGTNQIHGDFWEYVRNNILDARDFNALTIPAYHQNQFGGTLGLPIIKNRLFIFGYAEANRIVFGQTYTLSVPTALERQGNFSELLNPTLTSSGHAIPLYQPGSAGTQPLNCNGQRNVICLGAISAASSNLISHFPLPNTNNGKTFNNYVINANNRSNSWQWGIRLDYNVSSKDQAFVRVSYLNNPQYYPPRLGAILDGGQPGVQDGSVKNLGDNLAFSETHIFNANLTNELRYGFDYSRTAFLQPNYANNQLALSLGLSGIPSGPENGGLPMIGTGGAVSSFGTPTYYPNDQIADQFQFLDNVTKVLGNHIFKLGVDLQNVRSIFLAPPSSRGNETYNGFFTSNPGQAFTGNGLADFYLDQMANATLTNLFTVHNSRWYRAAYGQDDWRVTPRLTVNLGLRYDFYQPYKDTGGNQANFYVSGPISPGSGQANLVYASPQNRTTLAPAFLSLLDANHVTVQFSGNPALSNAQDTNFGPRLGFEYSLDSTAVIRGGFGIFYGGLEAVGGAPSLGNNYPFQIVANFPRATTCKPGNCVANGISQETGFAGVLAAGLQNVVSNPSFAGAQLNVKTPYSESYNLTAEKELTNSLAINMGYVGAVDRHLQVLINQNSPDALTDPRLNSRLVQPFPTLGGATFTAYAGAASYNALQATMQKKLTSGLDFLATYTWSHSMDDAPTPLGSSGDKGFRNPNLIGILNDYSNSPWDTRNRVTFNGYYEVPVGVGRRYVSHPGLLSSVVGGWATDLQFSAQSGVPITIGTDLGTSGPNGAGSNAILIRDPFSPGGVPDSSNPGVTCAQHTRTLKNWYNPCAFANPPLAFPDAKVAGSPVSTRQITGLAALPYLGGRRLSITGPGYERINMSVFKDVKTFHEQNLEFRTDIFNLLNTPAYGDPSTADDSSNGGLITGPRFFQNFTPDARFVQLSLRYEF